jgi:hypothetical protein
MIELTSINLITVLVVLAIVALLLFIFGRGRF